MENVYFFQVAHILSQKLLSSLLVVQVVVGDHLGKVERLNPPGGAAQELETGVVPA